eukprot:1231655-Rhodomonas_salina.1
MLNGVRVDYHQHGDQHHDDVRDCEAESSGAGYRARARGRPRARSNSVEPQEAKQTLAKLFG